MKIIIYKNNLSLVFFSTFLFLVFNAIYIYIISPYFFQSSFSFKLEFNSLKIIHGVTTYIVISFLALFIRNDFIKTIWFFVFILFFMGSIIFYVYNPGVSFGIVLQNIILLLFIFIADFFIFKINIKPIKISYSYKLIAIISLFLFLPFLFIYGRYISLENLYFSNIYETRLLFRQINNTFLDYLISPLSRVIIPIILIVSLKERKYIIAFMAIIAIMYLFLCSATKSVLIGLFASILFYVGKTWTDRVKIFLAFVLFLSVFGVLTIYLFDNTYIIDAFVRRVFFVPPYLDNVYHKHFTGNYTYWGHSPFGLGLNPLKETKYLDLTRYMGEKIMGHKDMNANVGIITEGYISAGMFGVIVHSTIYTLIFIYLKSLKVSPVFFGIIFSYIFYLNTSFLSTLLLTHGLFFLLIIFTIFLKNTEKNAN